jgi:hypothetical protein
MHLQPLSDVQPFVPPMPMPPMLGRDHHFFLLEVEGEVEEGVPGVRVSGVLRLQTRGSGRAKMTSGKTRAEGGEGRREEEGKKETYPTNYTRRKNYNSHWNTRSTPASVRSRVYFRVRVRSHVRVCSRLLRSHLDYST